jgi:hypothetical protein
MVEMTSMGNSAENSCTASKDVGSMDSATAVTFSLTIDSRVAMARGVNTLLTSLRIRV